MKIVYEDSKLSSLYPWIDMVEEIFTSSQTRALPTVENAEILDMVVIDQIIANVIYDHFSTGSSIETLLREAHIVFGKIYFPQFGS